MKWSQVEALFLSKYVPSMVVEGKKAIVPLDMALHSPDRALQREVRDAWQRETRSPRSLLFTLRAAFSHMHLYMIRTSGDHECVTAIKPVCLDAAHVVDAIKRMLEHVGSHAGCTRDSLLNVVAGTEPSGASEKSAVTAQLDWLIEKGHIIECADSTMFLPPPSAAAS